MKYIIVIVSIFCWALPCSATPQILDMLVMGKDTFFLYTSPLAEISNLIAKDSSFINKRVYTTANKRGFVASWELIGEQIYLTKISDLRNGKLEANLQTIFETKEYQPKIKATWINEEIIAHSKYALHGYLIGLSDVYEKEIILKVKSGKVLATEHLNNDWARTPNDNTSTLNRYVIKKLPKKLRKQIVKNKLDYEFYTHVTFDSKWQVKSIDFTKTEFDTMVLRKIITSFDDWKLVYKKGELMNKYAVKLKINSTEIKNNMKCWLG